MVSWGPLLKHSASGFADVPMAAYAFATIACLARCDLWLALPCLAGALLTKNEGLFTLVGALVVALWLFPPAAGASGVSRRWVPALLVGATGAVALGAWGIVKRRWGLAGDLLDPARWPPDLLQKLPSRAASIAAGSLKQALAVGPRYPAWGLLW